MSDLLIILLNVFWLCAGATILARSAKTLSRRDVTFLFYLFPYHQLFSILKGMYVSRYGGDARRYWYLSESNLVEQSWQQAYGIGTDFIFFLTYPLVNYLGISYYPGNLLFGLIGFGGCVLCFLIVRRFTPDSIKIRGIPVFPYFLLLPNLHFWTGGIGKDALIFPGILLYFYALGGISRKFMWALASLTYVFHIRPHIAMFMIIATFLAVLVDRKLRADLKVLLFGSSMAATAYLVGRVAEYLKLDELDLANIRSLSEKSLQRLSEGQGSAVDVQLPLPARIFTTLYRPLFFDANGVLGVFASLENVFFLWLTAALIGSRPIRAFARAGTEVKAMFLFFLICTVAFSYMFSNLGIILRQKNMIISCFVLFVIWSVVSKQSARSSRHQRLEAGRIDHPSEDGQV